MAELPPITSVAFFEGLARDMASRPEHFEVLGDADLDVVVHMTDPDGDTRIRLRFSGITCDEVSEAGPADAEAAHCSIVGTRAAWQAMFDDILANGRATGRQTLNALTMWGEDLQIEGTDPMGTDRVSRYIQTLQEFLDGAARLAAVEAPA